MKKTWFAFTVATCFAVAALADVQLNPVFTGNMMLQQEKPIAFFGKADPAAQIKVEFAGKEVVARADAQGAWRAEFPAMKAGSTNYTVKVSDGKKTVELPDVIIGDVWVCAGQSNMEMPIGAQFRRGWSAQNCEQEVNDAQYPEIRCADQRNVSSHNQLRGAELQFNQSWVKCSPAVAAQFSATGYFFARQLHRDLKTPIGLINLTWSGTRMEPWISLEGYKAAGLESDLRTIAKFTMTPAEKKAYEEAEAARYAREMAAYHKIFAAAGADAAAQCASYSKPDFDDSAWAKGGNQCGGPSTVRWYRTKFRLPADLKGKTLRLSCNYIPIGFTVYLNGRAVAERKAYEDAENRRFDLELAPDLFQQDGENVLACRTELYYGRDRDRLNTLLNRTALAAGKKRMELKTWKMCDEFKFDARKNGAKCPDFPNAPYKSAQFHSNLYNGMVDGWTKLPIKGVIWYQGCSNAGQPHYYLLHKAMIADWRAKWNQPELPFLIVQLAGFGDGNWQKTPPRDASYALTRDIQAQMIQLPNVGLACAVDIGEPTNIHPANKQEVGRRLALEAERIAYGKKVVSRGPMFAGASPEGDAIRVRYQYADSGLKTSDGKAPTGFAIAGADKKFVWANAEIQGDTVVVRAPAVKEPKFVRYAYAMYRGDLNLQNREGLPAYPFRSDAYDYSQVK